VLTGGGGNKVGLGQLARGSALAARKVTDVSDPALGGAPDDAGNGQISFGITLRTFRCLSELPAELVSFGLQAGQRPGRERGRRR
jgi:hypothetical protein